MGDGFRIWIVIPAKAGISGSHRAQLRWDDGWCDLGIGPGFNSSPPPR